MTAFQFISGHLELEFYSEEFSIAKPRVMTQAKGRPSLPVDLHLNNNITVYGGEYKGCHGVYKGGDKTMAKIQLEAKLMTSEVWVAREHVWDK